MLFDQLIACIHWPLVACGLEFWTLPVSMELPIKCAHVDSFIIFSFLSSSKWSNWNEVDEMVQLIKVFTTYKWNFLHHCFLACMMQLLTSVTLLKKKCLLWLASQAGEARLKLMFLMDMFFCIKLVLCVNLYPVTNFLCELSMLKVFICMIFFLSVLFLSSFY